MKVLLATPSYKRSHRLETAQWASKLHGIDFKVLVNAEDIGAYEAAHPELSLIAVPSAPEYRLGYYRQAILEYARVLNYDILFMVDDDTEKFRLRTGGKTKGGYPTLLNVPNLDVMFMEYIQQLDSNFAILTLTRMRKNALSFGAEYNFVSPYFGGDFMGINLRKVKEASFENMTYCENNWFQMKAWMERGRPAREVALWLKYCYETPPSNAYTGKGIEGGLSAVPDAYTGSFTDARKMQDEFWQYVRMKTFSTANGTRLFNVQFKNKTFGQEMW